jgi:serine/threonine-protein kinase
VIKVSDFGIAKTDETHRRGRMRTLGVVGSPAYMAPEQRSGARDLDRRADIYSLGIVFFELLVGQLPFVAATEEELFRLHHEAALPSVRRFRPELPPALDDIIARACAKDRRDRYSTCEELDAALVQSGMPFVRSVPPTVMATQGLPSFPPHGSSRPPPPADFPSYRPPPRFAAPPLAPNAGAPHAPFAAKSRSIWKYLAISAAALLVLAGGGLGIAFFAGAFDAPESPLVDPPKARDGGAAAQPAAKAPATNVPRAVTSKPTR